MSEHSVCFKNGMSGNCNMDCSQFEDGDCENSVEIIKEGIAALSCKEMQLIIEIAYNEVELFTLRGGGATDAELVFNAFRY